VSAEFSGGDVSRKARAGEGKGAPPNKLAEGRTRLLRRSWRRRRKAGSFDCKKVVRRAHYKRCCVEGQARRCQNPRTARKAIHRFAHGDDQGVQRTRAGRLTSVRASSRAVADAVFAVGRSVERGALGDSRR